MIINTQKRKFEMLFCRSLVYSGNKNVSHILKVELLLQHWLFILSRLLSKSCQMLGLQTSFLASWCFSPRSPANTASTLSCLQVYLPCFKTLNMRIVYVQIDCCITEFTLWIIFRTPCCKVCRT